MSEQSKLISRRDLLRGVGVAGVAAAAAPVSILSSPDTAAAAEPAAVAAQAASAAPREAFENLTAVEADLLEAIVDRLIPTDALGPGAREARAAHYIDRALGGALASSRQAYASGLAALDRYAHASRGKGFLELSASDKDSVLMDVESGTATPGIFAGSSAQFFTLVLNHTRQGTFGDPYYGGNANFVGWDLLGYPGVRTMVTAADQKAYEAGQLKPNHRSAYDYEGFNKATARVESHAGDMKHGD
ncbi:MAG TPA: gluconate 2-dehydrogenase subunit 3 family protein [Vicinamibacterales bacterium]